MDEYADSLAEARRQRRLEYARTYDRERRQGLRVPNPDRRYSERPPAQCKAEDCINELPLQRPWNKLFCSKVCSYRQSHRDEDRRSRYGVHGSTLEDYDRLFAAQNGRCAICGTKEPGGRPDTNRFAFDHDHTTNTPRGLLCFRCNCGLGNFRDNAELLQAAIAYLNDQPSAALTLGQGNTLRQ